MAGGVTAHDRAPALARGKNCEGGDQKFRGERFGTGGGTKFSPMSVLKGKQPYGQGSEANA